MRLKLPPLTYLKLNWSIAKFSIIFALSGLLMSTKQHSYKSILAVYMANQAVTLKRRIITIEEEKHNWIRMMPTIKLSMKNKGKTSMKIM